MKSCEIKAARVRLKYTQKYMAERLGIATGTYQKKENGAITLFVLLAMLFFLIVIFSVFVSSSNKEK